MALITIRPDSPLDINSVSKSSLVFPKCLAKLEASASSIFTIKLLQQLPQLVQSILGLICSDNEKASASRVSLSIAAIKAWN
jgi:hypothetical protein